MAIATVTSKGQVTIPAETRTRLRLVPGSIISFEENAAGETVVKAQMKDIRSLRGFLKYDGPPKSLEEIDQGIAKAVKERLDRCR
jgi:AbrB family looped-hinge helix DNA binding protein